MAEGSFRSAANVQQLLINALSADLRDGHAQVATERLRLGEIFAHLGDPHAAGTFTRAIYALAAVYGSDSTEARSARRRRRRALPSRSN